MKVERLTPILNVSNISESFAWFEKLGWQKGWDWGDPPTFGGVCSGECEIFLCQNCQGSRGGPMRQHAGDDSNEKTPRDAHVVLLEAGCATVPRERAAVRLCRSGLPPAQAAVESRNTRVQGS